MNRDDARDVGQDDAEADLRRRITAGYTEPSADANPAADPTPVQPAPFVDAAPAQQPEQQRITDPTSQSPSPSTNPIPTNADGSQVGSGIPWDPGTSAPSSAPAGYHWDPNMASFEPDAAPATQQQGAPDLMGRIQQALQAAGSTDDPNYWYQKISGDPNGAGSAWGYWLDRINRGDGALAVRNGTMQKFQDGAPAPTPAPGPSGVYQPATIAAPSTYTPPTTTAGLDTPQGLWSPDFLAQLREMLMSRLTAASTPVSENDSNIAAPLSAARDETARATDKERNQLAERLYAQGGLNTDAITQGIQQSSERNAGALSGLRASLITKELQSRRDELTSLMNTAIQSGDAQTARQVQAQIAMLDAQVKREGIGADLAKYQGYLNSIAGQSLTGV